MTNEQECLINENGIKKITKCVLCRTSSDPYKLICESEDGRTNYVCSTCCGKVAEAYSQLAHLEINLRAMVGAQDN